MRFYLAKTDDAFSLFLQCNAVKIFTHVYLSVSLQHILDADCDHLLYISCCIYQSIFSMASELKCKVFVSTICISQTVIRHKQAHNLLFMLSEQKNKGFVCTSATSVSFL